MSLNILDQYFMFVCSTRTYFLAEQNKLAEPNHFDHIVLVSTNQTYKAVSAIDCSKIIYLPEKS